jgi:hypothetical protein
MGIKLVSGLSRWLDGEVPATLYPTLFKHSKRKNRIVNDALAYEKWIRDVDYSMTVRMVEEFISLWIRLQGIAVQPTQEDKIT